MKQIRRIVVFRSKQISRRAVFRKVARAVFQKEGKSLGQQSCEIESIPRREERNFSDSRKIPRTADKKFLGQQYSKKKLISRRVLFEKGIFFSESRIWEKSTKKSSDSSFTESAVLKRKQSLGEQYLKRN